MTPEERIALQTRTIQRLRKELDKLTLENIKLSEELAAAKWPNFVANGEILNVEPAIYDEEERHPNCTVQILRNTVTGGYSLGWWDNDG